MKAFADLQSKADAHQRDLDAHRLYWSIGQVAARWGCSPNTVKAVPASLLPYLNIGTGLQRERRRYRPDDVYAYESRRLPKAG